MQQYKKEFDILMKVKSEPNQHEILLFERAQKYTQKLSWIPGIEMIAVVNSLSMFATHEDSDIDLFIVTKPHHIWLVRFLVTLTFFLLGVWRHGEDIAGNFCLSFFVTTEAMNLEKIAIEDDIYLYNWIYYLKPILVRNNTYKKFLKANSWVEISQEQEIQNERWEIQTRNAYSFSFSYFLNNIIRFFLLRKTLRTYSRIGQPEWVIISDDMLKFHDKDLRKEIRDRILEKNFDK